MHVSSISLRYSCLCLGLSIDLFSSGFPVKILRAFLILPIRATSSSHLVLLSLINIIIYEEEYKLLVSSLCSFLHQPLTSCFLVPITFLGTLFSNTVFPAGRETKCYTCIKRVNSLTDELIPWSRVLENVAKKFRALYGT